MTDTAANLIANLGSAWHVQGNAIANQIGTITGSGSPVGSVTPLFIGQDYFDTAGTNWWRAIGTTNTSWVEIGGASEAISGPTTITAANAHALAVGANGTTNPVFNVDASAASVATGMNVKGNAAGSGVAEAVTSSTTNESLTIDAKGSGTITLNGTATGAVVIGNGLNITDATNVVLGSTTGTKIGTATTQKLGFFGSTPVVQQAGATASGTTAVTTAATSTTPYGYATSTQANNVGVELAATVLAVNALITQLTALGLIA